MEILPGRRMVGVVVASCNNAICVSGRIDWFGIQFLLEQMMGGVLVQDGHGPFEFRLLVAPNSVRGVCLVRQPLIYSQHIVPYLLPRKLSGHPRTAFGAHCGQYLAR